MKNTPQYMYYLLILSIGVLAITFLFARGYIKIETSSVARARELQKPFKLRQTRRCNMEDRTTGWIILFVSLLGIIIYFYLLFLSPWSYLTMKISAFAAVGAILLIIAWIGYTLASTPPPMPLDDLNLEPDDNTEN